MVERVYLGWDQPFSKRAVAWLLDRRGEMPEMLVVVPTAQSGRRLREALAEAGGALLSPRVATPGSLLAGSAEDAASDWIEYVAWVEALESVADWSDYSALFPKPPPGDGDWASGLARELAALRQSLQESGTTLATAAIKLRETPEADRWAALAALEKRVEALYDAWGLQSRSRILSKGVALPADVTRIVLAGVAGIPPLLEISLRKWPGKTTVLLGAPESAAADFSDLGKPLPIWTERNHPAPSGSLQVAADARQQASEALRVVADAATPSCELALASADPDVAAELALAFTRAGWTSFLPSAPAVTAGLARWFSVWAKWLADPKLAVMADLLALPETSVLVGGRRAQKAKALANARDRWMVVRSADLRRQLAALDDEKKARATDAEEICQAAETLEKMRAAFLGSDFITPMTRLLETISKTGETTADAVLGLSTWLAEAAPVIGRLKREARFWVDLMVAQIPSPPPLPPEDRVLDVQGWLEIFHEPGSHLVLCGMNEGSIPSRGGGEPWLGEAARNLLGLTSDADRAARDGYLYHALLESRRDRGRVDVFCGKTGGSGDVLLPSRLLLAATREELPARVQSLFRDIEPPDASLRWHADWQWQPPLKEAPKRVSVTALASYLACPFRFYLNSVVRMQSPEPDRAEWSARDFGTVAHEVLENWGRDTEAREFEKTEVLHAWLSNDLDRAVLDRFGDRPPLAVRIQTESLRNRFQHFARHQGVARVEGWEIVDVERKVEMEFGNAVLVGRIDRIDRNRGTGRVRVFDYKTGVVKFGVEDAHRKKFGARTLRPEHWDDDCPAIFETEIKGKTTECYWLNLQLPLYAVALVRRGQELPVPCYFTLPSSAGDAGILAWDDFSQSDMEAAEKCAEWIMAKIAAGIFWPPAEKVAYDDFKALAAGRLLGEMCAIPGA